MITRWCLFSPPPLIIAISMIAESRVLEVLNTPRYCLFHHEPILPLNSSHESQGVWNHTPLHCLHCSSFRLTTNKSIRDLYTLPFVRRIYLWPMDSPHKWPIMPQIFRCRDVIVWPLLTFWGAYLCLLQNTGAMEQVHPEPPAADY